MQQYYYFRRPRYEDGNSKLYKYLEKTQNYHLQYPAKTEKEISSIILNDDSVLKYVDDTEDLAIILKQRCGIIYVWGCMGMYVIEYPSNYCQKVLMLQLYHLGQSIGMWDVVDDT